MRPAYLSARGRSYLGFWDVFKYLRPVDLPQAARGSENRSCLQGLIGRPLFMQKTNVENQEKKKTIIKKCVRKPKKIHAK